MTGKRHHGLIGDLRGELALFARVCLLILAVPMLYPLAQAEAAGAEGGQVICTQHGAAPLGEAGDLPFHAMDDCPCGILCPLHGIGAAGAGTQPSLAAALAPAASPALLQAGDAPRAPPSDWLRPPGRAPPFVL